MRIWLRCMLAAVILISPSASTNAHEAIMVATGEGANSPKQPQLAINSMGQLHVVYGVGDIVYHSVSSDDGKTCSPAKQVFRVPNMSLGMRRGPRIAATKNAVVVTAIGGEIGMGRDGDVLSWRSDDLGATWTGPVRVNDTVASAREGLHAMASAPDGSFWCVWLDLRDGKSEVYASRSVDRGITWGRNVRVYQSPDGSVCECCHPSVFASDKNLYVMFRNSLAGNRDMYLTSSSDQGQSFLPAGKIGQGAWKLDACPMDGGMLTVQSDEKVVSVWRRDDHIYSASDTDTDGTEVLLGRGQQPWIASNADGSFIVWTTGRTGDLMLVAPGWQNAKAIAKDARDPVVISSAESGRVFCCWEAKQSDRVAVFVQRLDAGGVQASRKPASSERFTPSEVSLNHPLFEESFDNDRLLERGWYDGRRFEIDSTSVQSGSGAIRYDWKAGTTTPLNSSGMRRLFEPSESVYLRCFIKLSKDWKWTQKPFHPHLMHFMTTENDKWHGPAASHLTVYIEPWNGRLRLAATDIQNKDAPHGLTQGPLRGGYNGTMFDSEEVLFNDDKWHLVEACFQLNSLNAVEDKPNADGVVQGWFDGKLVIDHTDVILRSTDFPHMKFNQFLLTPYFGPGLLPQAQTLWIDELAVGIRRVE